MDVLKKVVETLFILGVLVFMLLGSIIVVVQMYSVFVFNGPLAIKIMSTLKGPAFISATAAGLLGFIQGYINGWDMGD